VSTTPRAHCARMIFLLLLLIALAVATVGCSIGVKSRIVYAGFVPYPEESKGTVIIATNKKLPVTIAGTDFAGRLDLGGRPVITMQELKYFVEAVKENQQLKKRIKELEK